MAGKKGAFFRVFCKNILLLAPAEVVPFFGYVEKQPSGSVESILFIVCEGFRPVDNRGFQNVPSPLCSNGVYKLPKNRSF